MDSAESKESGKQSKVHFEMIQKETEMDGSVTDRSDSSSSYASDLSEEFTINNIFHNNQPVQPKPEVHEFPGAAQTSGASTPVSLSRVQSSSKSSSQIRLSGMLGNHDPNRIPVSIFSARPSNPMEWSIASTESLFSIHVGNNSFSRDHFNFQTKSGELIMGTDLNYHPANLPHFVEPPKAEIKSENTGNWPSSSTGPQNPAISNHSQGDHRKETLTAVDEGRGRSSVSCLSEDSINSARSFKFPVLASDHGASANSAGAQQPLKHALEHQSRETTSASPTSKMGCFSCFSWCPRR